jgi:hypothetical protein
MLSRGKCRSYFRVWSDQPWAGGIGMLEFEWPQYVPMFSVVEKW